MIPERCLDDIGSSEDTSANSMPGRVLRTHPCSAGMPQVYMRKIRLVQGVAHTCYHDGFHDLGTFDEAPGTVQNPGVRAGAQ